MSRYPLLLFLRLRILFSVTLTTSVFPTLLPSPFACPRLHGVFVKPGGICMREAAGTELCYADLNGGHDLKYIYIYKLKRVIGMAW